MYSNSNDIYEAIMIINHEQNMNNRSRLPLLILEKDNYFDSSSLHDNEWILDSKQIPNELNKLQSIISILEQNDLPLPQDILCISKSMLTSKQEKIGILATLVNECQELPEDKIKISLIVKSIVNILDIEQVNEHTACYELYNDLPIEDEPKCRKVIEELHLELKKYYPQRKFLTFNAANQIFADYAFNLAFFLYSEICVDPNESFYPEIEWFLTSRDPVKRLTILLERIRNDNSKLEQEALQWRQDPDLLQLHDENIPIIIVSEKRYKELLDFSKTFEVDLSIECIKYIKKHGITQLVIVHKMFGEYSLLKPKVGILVSLLKRKLFFLSSVPVQVQQEIVFNQYDKQEYVLLAQVFAYKENNNFTKENELLLEQCIDLSLSFLFATDNQEYFTLVNKILYLQNSGLKDKFRLILFLLLRSLSSIQQIDNILSRSTVSLKLEYLEYSLKICDHTIAEADRIRWLPEVPKNYIPCISIPESEFASSFTLNVSAEKLLINEFNEVTDEIYNTADTKDFEIILINGSDIEMGKLAVSAKVISYVCKTLEVVHNNRVKIVDLIIVNKIIYAKTELIDDILTVDQLTQVNQEFIELSLQYNKLFPKSYQTAVMPNFGPGLDDANNRFLHNQSYKMLRYLELPFFPVFNLLERFKLIKGAIKKWVLIEAKSLDVEYWQLSKEGNWNRALVKAIELINSDPENGCYYAYKARCFNRLERYEEAITNYMLGLSWYDINGRGEGTPAIYHSAIGKNWFQLGNLKMAADSFNKVNKDDLCELHAKEFEDYQNKLDNEAKDSISVGKFDINNIGFSIEKLPLPDNIRSYAKEIYISYQHASSTEKPEYRHQLALLLGLPWGNKSKLETDVTTIRQKLEQNHYGLEEIKHCILKSLIFSIEGGSAKPPILCLVGPPGVGKTSIANALAEALGRKCIRLPLGGTNDASVIKGFRRTYTGAEPSKVMMMIKMAGVWNPIMILDEIDKISQGVYKSGIEGALLALLDPEQNSQFSDDYFDATFDLSEIFFIATANSTEGMSLPLLNRMEVINISGYTDGEKLEIAKKHLIPKILEDANNNEIIITEQVIKEIIVNYTKESGIRELERCLRSLVQNYLFSKRFAKDKSLHLDIDEKLLEEYFGSKKISKEKLNQIPAVGKVKGLAYTSMGGSTISIEAMAISGTGKIKATGKLGEVLKESIEVAFARAIADLREKELQILDISKNDIHVHLLEGATPKEGHLLG